MGIRLPYNLLRLCYYLAKLISIINTLSNVILFSINRMDHKFRLEGNSFPQIKHEIKILILTSTTVILYSPSCLRVRIIINGYHKLIREVK